MIRRNFLAASLVTTFAGCAHVPNTPSRQPLKLGQGFEDFAAYFRIMSDLGGASTFRYHAGKALYVPKPHDLAVDFVDFVGLKQDRTRRLANGDFQHAYKGITLFTDPHTGEVLKTLENPVTGKTNTVKHFATSGGSIVYTPKGAYSLKPFADPNVTPKIGLGPVEFDWDTSANDAWITYPERFAFYDKDGNVRGADNSMYRYMVSLDQLNDPTRSNVDSVMNWQTETGMWEWMEMKGNPGHFIFGSMGRKYASLDQVPARYVAACEEIQAGHVSKLIDWSDFVLLANQPV